nr:RNA-dependent RNA polymerase [Picobirnavirus sp.]
MRKQSNNFSSYFKLPNPGLEAYFSHVRKGNDVEYRTTFYKGKSVEDVLVAWNRHLKPIHNEWPTLYEFEDDLRKKVGPMSIMLPLSERMTDIDNYYDLISLDQAPIPETALRSVINEWEEVPSLHLRSQQATVDSMKKSTSSGNPFFTKRRNVVGDTVPCKIIPEGKDWKMTLPKSVWKTCAVLGWRGQEGGPDRTDTKQRVVWMFPFAANVSELQVYQPLIEAAQQHNLVPAWVSMEAVDQAITQLFDTKGDDDLIVCTDFSKFDQHFNPACQKGARQILEALFDDSIKDWLVDTKGDDDLIVCTDFSKFDQHFNPACQKGARQILEALFDDSIKDWLVDTFPLKYAIPLAYDYGKIRYGVHGMASGSGGTNADETLLHRALQYEAAEHHGVKLNPHSMCLGDDGILSYPGITADEVVKVYSRHGLEMNPDKQYTSKDDCTYLRRWHHKDYRSNGVCVGVYSTFRALGRLMEQERYYNPEEWGPKMVALRQLSIIENCKHHPLREKFADFCMRGDKYRLGLDIPGFLANIDSEASKAIENIPDFLGYTKSMQSNQAGISSWWIVKYLKSKR